MPNKLILCRTRLEEAASHLRELVAREGELDAEMKLRLVTALGYLDKAAEVLRQHADPQPEEE